MCITFQPEPSQRADSTWDMHHGSPQLNVSNTNAAFILERLGIEFDHCGSIPADDILGRALVANIGRDDSGVTPSETSGTRLDVDGTTLLACATVIDCGLPAGYYEDRMTALVEVAQAAKTLGVDVQWA